MADHARPTPPVALARHRRARPCEELPGRAADAPGPPCHKAIGMQFSRSLPGALAPLRRARPGEAPIGTNSGLTTAAPSAVIGNESCSAR